MIRMIAAVLGDRILEENREPNPMTSSPTERYLRIFGVKPPLKSHHIQCIRNLKSLKSANRISILLMAPGPCNDNVATHDPFGLPTLPRLRLLDGSLRSTR